MFSQERMAPFLQALSDRMKTFTLTALRQQRSPAMLIKAAEAMNAQIEANQTEAYKAYEGVAHRHNLPVIACKKGCTWCCFQSVAVTLPEVLIALQWVDQHFDESQKASLVERLERHVREHSAWKASGSPYEYNQACAFLQEGACTIHPVRPAACRGFNSSDAAVCRHNYEHPEELKKSISWDVQWRIALDTRMGLEDGLGLQGLDDSNYEFLTAFLAVLRDPKLVDRYLSGERPLAEYVIVGPLPGGPV